MTIDKRHFFRIKTYQDGFYVRYKVQYAPWWCRFFWLTLTIADRYMDAERLVETYAFAVESRRRFKPTVTYLGKLP